MNSDSDKFFQYFKLGLMHTRDNMIKNLHQLQESLELDQRTAAFHLIKSIATQEQFEIGKSLIENIYST